MVLDLVNAVEEGQHLNVANIPPPKNTLHGLTNQRALQVHAKQFQLEVSSLSTSTIVLNIRCLLISILGAVPASVLGHTFLSQGQS